MVVVRPLARQTGMVNVLVTYYNMLAVQRNCDIFFVGVIGNTFVIGAVLVERTLRNMGVAFIINLAVVDLVVTAWLIPVILANVLAVRKKILKFKFHFHLHDVRSSQKLIFLFYLVRIHARSRQHKTSTGRLKCVSKHSRPSG